MKKFFIPVMAAGLLLCPSVIDAKDKVTAEKQDTSMVKLLLDQADSSETPIEISLQQALQIALSENISVKVADKEIMRTQYAKKGTYASLFPKIDVSAAYQRTIKKQVMYMDGDGFDFSKMIGEALTPLLLPLYLEHPGLTPPASSPSSGDSSSSSKSGFEVGRVNTLSAGLTAAMPIVNPQLWESIKISGIGVELAVEKARSSRLDMVTQVKQAYYSVLLAKEALNVYNEVYDNALKNYAETEKKYNAQKASELELTRAKTTVANAIPNVYNAESQVILALWQLKAVIGIDLDTNIDTSGSLDDYSQTLFYQLHQMDSVSLDNNTTMRQLALQAEQLARTIRVQKFAYIPTLAAQFSFTYNAMANDVKFSEFQWTPYSYVGLSLSIPVFSGFKRLNDVRQAKNQYEQVQLQTTNTERNLKIAIRQSLNTMETSMKNYYAAQSAVEMAQKGYDIAERAYQVGRSTLIELNDAQLALTQSKLGESQAVYNFIVAKAQLEQIIGEDFVE